MGLPPEADEHTREPTGSSPGGPASAKTLQLRLLASEDERRRLQHQVFLLGGRLVETDRRIEQYMAEASMSAQGLRRCAEEKAAMAAGCADLAGHRTRLEKECALYEGDVTRLMESCDEQARENEELKVQLKETPSLIALVSEVESLRKDKEHMRINLHRAEEEVKVLFNENAILDEENKRLVKELNREHHNQGSGGKHSASASAKVRRKRKSNPADSFPVERVINFNNADLASQTLSPLQHSRCTRLHKK